ncbi:type IV secretion system protein VirB11 [Archaeoglobales archaeon]|nr:MAG: type IV secretion system protein VirB11 [Archaeoglobales archaeon]
MNVARIVARKLIKGYKIKTTVKKPVKYVEHRRVRAAAGAAGKAEKGEVVKVVEKFEIPSLGEAKVKISAGGVGAVGVGKVWVSTAGVGAVGVGIGGAEKFTQLKYSLIPSKPRKDESVFAYANIKWDDTSKRYIYMVVEPKLSPKLEKMLKRIKELLEERLDIDFSKLKKFEAKEYLNKQITELLEYFGFEITKSEKDVLRYYIERDFIGLGKIEPLMQDDQIEDISCDGVGIPIFVFHRDPKIGSVMTNVVFEDGNELDSFIIRMAQLCGKSISVASPLLDGALPDGSRLQATLATDIARRGSNFTIRKFTKNPLTPTHLLNYGTLDVRSLAYLWFVVDYGCSVLVCGGTASGKTTLLNVLSLFIKPDKKIVSIEDTAELRLPHPHWVPTVARTSIAGEGIKEVDLFDLLKSSFRQRPDYIIVGEVRGKEAYILFQQMATGHPSLATIHAENITKLMDRLTSPPIDLPPGLIGSLDLIVFLQRMKYKDKFVRRMNEVIEMVRFDPGMHRPVVNTVFKWNSMNDTFENVGKSVMLKKIADRSGLTEREIKEELKRRMIVLAWLKENNILDYRDVHRVFNAYYTDPDGTLSTMMGD